VNRTIPLEIKSEITAPNNPNPANTKYATNPTSANVCKSIKPEYFFILPKALKNSSDARSSACRRITTDAILMSGAADISFSIVTANESANRNTMSDSIKPAKKTTDITE